MSSFVGRRPELAAVSDVAEAAATGREPGSILITGTPGSGKTRLLAEVESRLSDWRVWRIGGYEAERSVPLAAARSFLQRAVPDWVTHEGDAAALFEKTFRVLVGAGKAALLVDDLQWLDETTFGLSHWLARAAAEEGVPLLLVMASRPGEEATRMTLSLERVLNRSRPASFRRIALGPLSRDEGVALAVSIDESLGGEAAVRAWEKAGGIPFWIEVLASHGLQRDVGNLIEERMAGAGADETSLFTLLCLAGRPLAPQDVAVILKWGDARVQSTADHLVSRALVLDTGEGLAPAHDLIRGMAVTQIPERERRRLHEEIAAAFEAAPSDDVALLRSALVHRNAAGLPCANLVKRLLESPNRRLLGREGLRELAAVVTAELVSHEAAEMHMRIAGVAREIGEHELALERFRAVAATATDQAMLVRAGLDAARSSLLLRRLGEANTFLDQAKARITDNVQALSADVATADLLRWGTLDHNAARRLSESTLEASSILVRERPDDDDVLELRWDALGSAFDDALTADDIERLEEVAFERRTFVVDLQKRGLATEERVARAGLQLADAFRWAARLKDAEALLRSVLARARTQIMPPIEIDAAHGLAGVMRQLGKLTEAFELIDEAAALGDRVGVPSNRAVMVLGARAEIEISLGRREAGLQQLHAQAEQEGDPHFRLGSSQQLAVWLTRIDAAGNAQVARDAMARGLDDSLLAGCRRCRREILLRAGEVFGRIGDAAAASDALAEWHKLGSVATGIAEMWALRAEAWSASAAGDVPSARRHLDRLVTRAHEAELFFEEVWGLLDIGTMTEGDRAVASLTRAGEIAGEMGAATEGALAAQRLRALGVRSWKRGSARGPAGLSPRELEVAKLVASGASNPEVAAALFLSRRTVERHISNIFAKLGVRNRTELASRIAREL